MKFNIDPRKLTLAQLTVFTDMVHALTDGALTRSTPPPLSSDEMQQMAILAAATFFVCAGSAAPIALDRAELHEVVDMLINVRLAGKHASATRKGPPQ